jgi:HAMP domain-containing protein
MIHTQWDPHPVGFTPTWIHTQWDPHPVGSHNADTQSHAPIPCADPVRRSRAPIPCADPVPRHRVGFLEQLPQSLRLLQALLGWRSLNLAAHANPLSRCVARDALPTADMPTTAQRAEVEHLLTSDMRLYDELRRRFSARYREVFGVSP